MRRKILIVLTVVVMVGLGVLGYTRATNKTSTDREQQREQRHLEREKRRAERQAEYERYVDSIVLARNYQFVPQTMQQQPAGSVRMLNNANFELSVWGSEVDIFLP